MNKINDIVINKFKPTDDSFVSVATNGKVSPNSQSDEDLPGISLFDKFSDSSTDSSDENDQTDKSDSGIMKPDVKDDSWTDDDKQMYMDYWE